MGNLIIFLLKWIILAASKWINSITFLRIKYEILKITPSYLKLQETKVSHTYKQPRFRNQIGVFLPFMKKMGYI